MLPDPLRVRQGHVCRNETSSNIHLALNVSPSPPRPSVMDASVPWQEHGLIYYHKTAKYPDTLQPFNFTQITCIVLSSAWFKQPRLTHESEKHQLRVFVPCGSHLCFQTLNKHFNTSTLISSHSSELWDCLTRDANMHCSRSFLLFCKTQSQSHVQGATVIS